MNLPHFSRWLRRCLAVALAAVSLPLLAQNDQALYTDSLVNGWQDWSWAVVNLSANSPVRSGTKSASVTADAWEAIYLHHAAFDSSGYSDLVFWLHGGSTGGQLLQVQGLLGGTAQTVVQLPALAANTWQQFTIPLASLGVANRGNLDGFWIQDRSGTTRPAFYVDDVSLKAVPPPATVNVTVNAGQTLRTIDARHFGMNAAIWDAQFATATTVQLLQEMANQTLRFPGGSLSDEYHWQTGTTLNNTWQWATTFDEFANVATQTLAQVFITANYGTGTPTEAADWVRYANVTKGYGFKYWEIGNENYGSWEADAQPRPHDPYTYALRFKDYWQQMKAVDPSIKIGAVVITGEDSYANYTDHPVVNPRTGQTRNGWTPVMLATLKSLGITPDYVIFHRYPQAPGAESDAGLLASSGSWAADAADLRQQLNDYLGAAGPGVELVCTENNSVYSNPGKQTTSLVNGLFLADSLGAALRTEFNAVVWWDFRNSRETGNNNSASLYGWRAYGDYGVVSDAVPAGPADRFPTFYVAKLLQRFARGGDALVAAASDYHLLTAHAARRADGSLSVLVINKSPATTLNASLALGDYTLNGALNVYSYGIPQDEAARTGTGSADLAVQSFSGVSSPLAFAFPPYSVSVLSFNGTLPPPPPVVRKPDVQVKISNDTAYVGDNLYGTDGTNQTRAQAVKPGRSGTFHFLVQNDGSTADSFTVRGPGSSGAFTVRYYVGLSGGSEITSAVTGAGWSTGSLAAGSGSVVRAVVTVARNAALNTVRDTLVTGTSAADPTKVDAARARVTVN